MILTLNDENSNAGIKKSILKNIVNNTTICIFLIGLSGFLIRLHYFPHDVPIILDGSIYFWYAIDASILGHFPTSYQFPNNGWPAFLSLFFALIKFENFMSYMELQRFLTVVISTLTIIPIYLLSRRFFEKTYSLMAAFIFAFDPRIIINSLLGIIEPSFILLGTFSLFLILSNKIKIAYLSFVTSALFALVRYEGLLLIAPISILFLIRFRKEKQILIKFLFAIGIFALILLPMMYERLQTTGQDGLVSHIIAGTKAHIYISEYPESGSDYYIKVLQQTVVYVIQYLGWVMIPNFVFFVPAGLILFFMTKRNKINDKRIIALVLFLITMLIPAAYAYSRGYQEPRYLLILFPIFSLISVFTIKQFLEKVKRNTTLIVIIIVVGILIGSIVYIENKGLNKTHQEESYQIAIKISKLAKGINPYSEIEYIKTSYILNSQFPTLKSMIIETPKIIQYSSNVTFNEFISENRGKGLTHIVTDGLFVSDSKVGQTLNDVFLHEKRYQYLKKVYDSSYDDYGYRLKVFEIDYRSINQITQ